MARADFVLRQVGWDLRATLIFRPALITAGFAVLGYGLPLVESTDPWPALSRFLAAEPGTAQTVLTTIAGSMITIVSSVYSILVVALTLASMQFSTRVVIALIRDRIGQNSLGMCIGTFVYALLVLRTIHSGEPVFVPSVAVGLAPVSALLSVGALVWFIHHIAQAIQANHLVDRIATECEGVIDQVMPAGAQTPEATPEVEAGAHAVAARSSGYLQLVDVAGLESIAAQGLTVQLARPVGAFFAEGVPALFLHPPERITPALEEAALACLDIGPIRTMQQDIEYGFRQIVDIALKAVSPAVNDPSTAVTCVDHLGRLLVRVASRPDPRTVFPAGTGRVVIPNSSFGDLLELALDQIRQYTRTDMAVTLRLLRVLDEVALSARDPERLARVDAQALQLENAARSVFSELDLHEFHRRRDRVRRHCHQGR